MFDAGHGNDVFFYFFIFIFFFLFFLLPVEVNRTEIPFLLWKMYFFNMSNENTQRNGFNSPSWGGLDRVKWNAVPRSISERNHALQCLAAILEIMPHVIWTFPNSWITVEGEKKNQNTILFLNDKLCNNYCAVKCIIIVSVHILFIFSPPLHGCF